MRTLLFYVCVSLCLCLIKADTYEDAKSLLDKLVNNIQNALIEKHRSNIRPLGLKAEAAIKNFEGEQLKLINDLANEIKLEAEKKGKDCGEKLRNQTSAFTDNCKGYLYPCITSRSQASSRFLNAILMQYGMFNDEITGFQDELKKCEKEESCLKTVIEKMKKANSELPEKIEEKYVKSEKHINNNIIGSLKDDCDIKDRINKDANRILEDIKNC